MSDKNDLDLSTASTGVWLVKVPKFVAEKWNKAEGRDREVGKLRISKGGPRREVTFLLNEQIARKKEGEADVPTEYKFNLSTTVNQTISIFSETPVESTSGRPEGETSSTSTNTKVTLEGKVIQRAECRPFRTDSFLRLKKTSIELAHKPTRSVQQLDRAVTTSYKPVKDHKSNIDFDKKKKGVEKRSRKEKIDVMDMLFNAFEKHQYYNIRDLQILTEQPITYLKEILKEIGIYNMKAPHKNMWELKPEYRHYAKPDEDKS
ncbi:general transcription factor IIF subunit 2-like [Glandiceps talaboti]